MNKETIGKVQLAIGIILLIVGIVGVIVSVIIIKNQFDYADNILEGEDVNEILMMMEGEKMSTYILAGLIIGATSIITSFISLLFITQGLANKSESVRN